mgnify:FL=1
MDYRNHDLKPQLKKIVELGDEAEQAEALALLEEKIRLNQRNEEVDLELRVKGIDTLTDSYTEELLKEAREHVKPLSTAKRLYNYVAGKVRRKPKKSAAVAALVVLTGIAVPALAHTHIFENVPRAKDAFQYCSNNGIEGIWLPTYYSVKKTFEMKLRSDFSQEIDRKLDLDCNGIITIKEFAESYQKVKGHDLFKKWKITPTELEEEIELKTSEYGLHFDRRDINCWKKSGNACWVNNRITINSYLVYLNKFNQDLPKPSCKIGSK